MRASQRVIVGGCLAACVTLLVSSCGEFSAAQPSDEAGIGDGGAGDATSTCAETCADRTACTLWDFSASCEPFEISNPNQARAADCASGKMHLAAASTEDLTASATRTPPTNGYSLLRVALRLSAARWDGKRAIQIRVGGTPRATMTIDDDQTGTLTVALCRESPANCVAPTVAIAADSEHLFTFDIDESSTKLSVDCVEKAAFPTSALEVDANVEIELGHTDANPIDGTFDDVLVWFKP